MKQQTEDQILLKFREQSLLNEAQFNRNEFPSLSHFSSGALFDQLPIPKEKKQPEFIFLKDYFQNKNHAKEWVTIAEWNMVWEVGPFRTDFFWQRLPQELDWSQKSQGDNIYLVPDHLVYSYHTFPPLFTLLLLNT